MTHAEFEKLAGYQVSYDDYKNTIEPMYMAIDASKEDFVTMVDKKRFAVPAEPSAAVILRSIRKEAEHLRNICGRYTDHESRERLEKLGKQYAAVNFGLDMNVSTDAWLWFDSGYEFPDIRRGCTYPAEMVIGRGNTEYCRVSIA